MCRSYGAFGFVYKRCVSNDVSILRSYRITNNKYPTLTMCRSYGAFGFVQKQCVSNDVSLLRSFWFVHKQCDANDVPLLWRFSSPLCLLVGMQRENKNSHLSLIEFQAMGNSLDGSGKRWRCAPSEARRNNRQPWNEQQDDS
jgi:hypothetical protein